MIESPNPLLRGLFDIRLYFVVERWPVRFSLVERLVNMNLMLIRCLLQVSQFPLCACQVGNGFFQKHWISLYLMKLKLMRMVTIFVD